MLVNVNRSLSDFSFVWQGDGFVVLAAFILSAAMYRFRGFPTVMVAAGVWRSPGYQRRLPEVTGAPGSDPLFLRWAMELLLSNRVSRCGSICGPAPGYLPRREYS
jgi:hypothetical protein